MAELQINLSAAHILEKYLGDPRDAKSRISIESLLLSDTEEEFPQSSVDVLNDWGVAKWFVPKRLGGELVSMADSAHVMRAISRRDLTLAIAYGKTYLGAVPVWFSGTPTTQVSLADFVIGGGSVCLALTEREHGADLLNIDTNVTMSGANYIISGEKWLINNASRAGRITVLARDIEKSGPRSLSLFHFSKDMIDGNCKSLPKERTLGIRAADISGFNLTNATVGKDSLLGEMGGGFELIIKSLQLTRVSCCALSLGAGDHAVRIALSYIRNRYIYNRFAIDITMVRRRLSRAILMVLIADALSNWAFKVADCSPERLVTASPVAKVMVPFLIQRAIDECEYVLGSRSYIISSDITAPFQKINRDHRLVALFDGSTTVNLQSLIVQFRSLAIGFDKPYTEFELFSENPSIDYALDALRLMPGTKTPDPIWSIYAASSLSRLPSDICEALVRLRAFTEALHRDMKDPAYAHIPSGVKSFSVAWRYCLAYSAASLVQAILNMPASLDAWGGSGWAIAAIDLLCNFHRNSIDSLEIDLVPQLIDCLDGKRLFSLDQSAIVDSL